MTDRADVPVAPIALLNVFVVSNGFPLNRRMSGKKVIERQSAIPRLLVALRALAQVGGADRTASLRAGSRTYRGNRGGPEKSKHYSRPFSRRGLAEAGERSASSFAGHRRTGILRKLHEFAGKSCPFRRPPRANPL
jgi:hypothetical protein